MQQSPSWAKHCETQMQEHGNAPAFYCIISGEWYFADKYALSQGDIRQNGENNAELFEKE